MCNVKNKHFIANDLAVGIDQLNGLSAIIILILFQYSINIKVLYSNIRKLYKCLYLAEENQLFPLDI